MGRLLLVVIVFILLFVFLIKELVAVAELALPAFHKVANGVRVFDVTTYAGISHGAAPSSLRGRRGGPP